jgi:hypothetical protein
MVGSLLQLLNLLLHDTVKNHELLSWYGFLLLEILN